MPNIIELKTYDTYYEDDENIGASALRNVFDLYAEYSITEEQVERVLAPVIKMIQDGKFDKPRQKHFTWLFKSMMSIIAVGALILVISFW